MTATFKLSRHQLSEQFHLAWWDATRCLSLIAAVILIGLAAYFIVHDMRTSWPGNDLPLVAYAQTSPAEATV